MPPLDLWPDCRVTRFPGLSPGSGVMENNVSRQAPSSVQKRSTPLPSQVPPRCTSGVRPSRIVYKSHRERAAHRHGCPGAPAADSAASVDRRQPELKWWAEAWTALRLDGSKTTFNRLWINMCRALATTAHPLHTAIHIIPPGAGSPRALTTARVRLLAGWHMNDGSTGLMGLGGKIDGTAYSDGEIDFLYQSNGSYDDGHPIPRCPFGHPYAEE
jgi:hypothetical protein